MLGVAADDFHLASNDIEVYTQEEIAAEQAAGYPAPHNGESGGRPALPATYSMIPGMGESTANSFMPGFGDLGNSTEDSFMPGFGDMAVQDSMLPGLGQGPMAMLQNPMVLAGAAAVAWAFLTKGGKKFRKSIGLAK